MPMRKTKKMLHVNFLITNKVLQYKNTLRVKYYIYSSKIKIKGYILFNNRINRSYIYHKFKLFRIFTYETHNHYTKHKYSQFTRKRIANYLDIFKKKGNYSNIKHISKHKANENSMLNKLNIINLFNIKKLILPILYSPLIKIFKISISNFKFKSLIYKIRPNNNKINLSELILTKSHKISSLIFINKLLKKDILFKKLTDIFLKLKKYIIMRENNNNIYVRRNDYDKEFEYDFILYAIAVDNLDDIFNNAFDDRFNTDINVQYELHEMYLTNENQSIYFKHLFNQYNEYIDYFFIGFTNKKKLLKKFISKINYTNYNYSINTNTYHLFTIKIIGFLSKYYLKCFNHIDNNQINKNILNININNIFKFIPNKTNNIKYTLFSKYLTSNTINNNVLLAFENNFYYPIKVPFDNTSYLYYYKMKNKIRLKINNKNQRTSEFLHEPDPVTFEQEAKFGKLSKVINLKNKSLLSSTLYKNIFSYNESKNKKKQILPLNIYNKKTEFNLKLYKNRQHYISTYIKNKDSLFKYTKQSIFYNHNVEILHKSAIAMKLILIYLISLLPTSILVLVQNNKTQKQTIVCLINAYIYIIQNYRYNSDNIIQTNEYLKYTRIIIKLIINLQLIINNSYKFNLDQINNYKILKSMYFLIGNNNNNLNINKLNYEYYINSYNKLNKKLFSKIIKLKLKNKINIHQKNIKYLEYYNSINTIFIRYNDSNTNLNNFSKYLFYMKSIDLNNAYNLYSKSNILNFKKSIKLLSSKYEFNRWSSIVNIILDLFSNYKTIHKDSTMFDINQQKYPIYKKEKFSKYLLETKIHPYPRNLFKTSFNNNILSKLLNYFANPFIWGESDGNLFELDRGYKGEYLISSHLYNYIKGLETEMPSNFFSQVSLRMFPNNMIQSNFDIITYDFNLWNIPLKQFNFDLKNINKHIYKPSYFKNEIYYLDYVDYIFYKYLFLESFITHIPKKWNKDNKKWETDESYYLDKNKLYSKNYKEFIKKIKEIKRYKKYRSKNIKKHIDPQIIKKRKIRTVPRIGFIDKKKKEAITKFFQSMKTRYKEGSFYKYQLYLERVIYELRHKKLTDILRGKINFEEVHRMEKARKEEIKKKKEQKKMIRKYDFLTKLRWDINMFDLNYKLPVRNINFEMGQSFLKLDNPVISVADYISSNLSRNDVDITPFQIAALRIINQSSDKNDKSNLKEIKDTLKSFFDKKMTKHHAIASGNDRLLRHKRVLNIFDSNKTLLKKENNMYSTYFYIQSKIKTFNRLGINDLSIFPHYLNTDLEKEIYLYRNVVKSIYEENDSKIKNVEYNRYTKSIINLNSIFKFLDLINNKDIQHTILNINLYTKNIIYYSQIIMSYHNFYKSVTIDLLNNTFDTDYEWNLRESYYIPRDKDKEDELPNLKSVTKKYINTKNKNYFYSDSSNPHKFFYDTIDTTIELDYPEYENDYAINLINKSNRELIENLYLFTTDNEYKSKKLDNSTIIKFFNIIYRFNKEFHDFMELRYNKAKYINTQVMKLSTSNIEYEKYRYNIIEDINNIIRKNVALKLPISIMLLYMARYPFEKEFYKYINHNMMHELYDNLWLYKSIIIDSYIYLNDADYNILTKQMYKSKLHKYNSSNNQLKNENDENIIKNFIQHKKITKYDRLYNLFLERRFIWYLSKTIYSKKIQQQIPYNIYNNIYTALNIRSKYTNNKLSLNNIEYILKEYININNFIHNIAEIPYLYYTNSLNRKKIYMQMEAVMGVARMEYKEHPLIFLFYKHNPFQLCESNISKQLFVYYSIGQITYWDKKGQYIIYPVYSTKNKKCIHSFIRYRIQDIDIEILKEINLYETFETTKLFKYILYSDIIKQLGEIKKITIYQEYFNHIISNNHLQYKTKMLYYHMYNKINIGTLNYLIDVTNDHNRYNQLINLLDVTKNNLPYLKYTYHNIIDEISGYYFTEEKTGSKDPSSVAVSYDEETTGYTHLPYTFELENILLFRFMHNLEIKKLIFSKKEYKISLNSNRLALLFYSILTEPIGLMAMYLMMEFMDTESLSIIKYNLQRIPKLTSSDLQYILAFPLEISIGEDFEEEPEDDILFGSIYLRTDYYGIQNYVNWPEYIDDDDELGNLHIAIETEPLRLIGIELNISPLFRIFTFSGWKVWKETINLLLLFQNNKLWNINYYIDTTIFNNLYSSMSNKFINKPIQSISDLRETLKSYNLHENILQPYLNKYHRANNLHSMKEWFDWYSYGLFEYQRTIPISYEKIFTQPAIRLFLYYFFINNKEYQFLTKNTLNNLMGSIYSMQLNPLDNEEFFVYPNKRVHAYRTYTPALLKRASWLENYSKPISNYQLPRTGYEAYIYSYASNLWYTHHNLITSSAFWHEIYKGIDYFSMEDPGDIGSIIVQTKYYLKKIKNFLFAETNKKEYGYLHKPYDRSIHRRFRCTEHEISPENIVSRKQAMRLYNAKEFIMYDLLKDFFVPNTVKFNDLNLLYKAFTYKQPIENNTNIKLHPSIQDKYTIKTNHRIDSYTNSLNIIYPKQKANKMLFFSVIYTNSIPEDKLNLIRGLNPLYSYINIQPSLKEVVKSHIWYSKSLINSNAVYHENSYGPLWSIYQRNFVSTKNALNNVLIGNTKEVINDGLVGLKRGLLVDPVDDAITDISRYEKGILLMPSTLPIKAGVYPEVKTHSTQEIEDVIALFEYNQENLNSDYHSRINVLGNEEGHYQHRSYGNMLMKVLHSMYFPINMYNQKEYTSYIPIGYNLNVKDLLNSNYQRLNYWYNPVYKRLYNTFYDIKIIHSDMSRLSANPTHVFELANLSEENNLYKDIRDSKSKYYMLNSESSYFNEFKKKLISKTLDTEKPSDTNIKSDAQKRLFIWYKQISNTSKQIGNISKQMSKIIKDKLIETYPIRKSLNKKESSLKQKELKNVTKAREHLQQEEKHIEQKKGYLQQRIEDERKYIKHTQAGNIYLLKEAFIQPYVKMYKAVKKGYNDMGYYIYTGAHTANKIMREQVIKPLWEKIWKKQPVLTEQQLARLRYREHQIIRHREQLVAQFLEDFRRNPSDLLIRQMNEFATGYEDTYKGLVILSHYDPIVTSEIVLCMYHLDPNLYHKTMVKMIRDHPKFVDIHIQRILYDTTEIKKRYESDKRFHTLLSFYRSKLYGQGDTKDFLFGPFIRFYQGVKQIDVYKYVNNIYNIYNNINVISSTINKEIKKGIYNSTNFITNSINSKIINTHKNINNLTNILQEQIINNTTIKVKNIPSYNILQKTIDDLNLEIETQEEEVSEEIIEDTESRIDLVQGYRTYGQYRYPDLYFPIFQSYAPQKQPHQLNKILNNAIIYKNRYRFIDIYESFRIKPFLYAQKDDISCKNSIINYHINNTKKNIKKFINYFIYPFENQISNNRSTKRLLRLELDTLESPYIRKGINYYESYKKFLEEEWQQKYLKFYTGFKIVEGNEYIDYKSIGFNLNKPWLFKLTNIIHKFDWYNRTIQSRYQKASKNFFPTVIVNRLSTRMGLSKYENINYNIRYHPNLFLFKYKNKDLLEKYFPVIPEKDKSKEERLQFQKKVIKGVENYVKLKERIRRRKELEGTHASSFDLPKIVNNKKMNYKIPKSFLKALEIEELSEKKNDLTYMYGKRQNKNFFTMKNYFIDRFSKPKDAAISPQYNIPVKTIQTNHGIRREFNTSRTYMEIISKYQFDFNTDPEIMDPDMIEPIEHEPDTFYLYQDQLIDALTEEWETPKELLINNILKNINTKYHKYLKEDDISQMIEEIQPLNNVFYKNKHDDNIDTIYDTVGRTVYSEKKKGFSYKINDFISSKSYNFFNNWTYYTKYFVDTVINTPIAERYNYNIKPFKYSVKKYNFRDHIYDLLENRSNLYIYSNQITEPLVLTPHPGFAKVVRQRHYFDKDRFVIRDDSIVEHDDIEDMERFHKNLPASSYNTEESIYRTSYWQYMMPKSLYNSSKFNTMEFITYKSNPHAAIDQSDNETFNTTIIKGSSINKEIAYNYKINYKKYSLPLIEYLYYTQFGVDNTNLLQINKLYILSKYTPTIFNEYYNTVYPYILEKKKYVEPRKKLDDAYHKISTQTKKTKTKKLFTFTENLDNNNISELINSMNYMFIDVDNLDNIYLYNNTMVRPITHWFLQIYYNNIHYFDAFFSWCNDLITNIIIT